MNHDFLVVGAGLSGCVIAERIAKILKLRVLLIDKRNHIAGNCYDNYMDNGILVHSYGPHYFRTNSSIVLNYLSIFTEWIEGNYIVKSYYNRKLFPFPINLDTLELFFNTKFNKDSAKSFIEAKITPFESPTNSEEFVLSRVGKELYEAFYLNYTLKQWGLHPKDLHPSVCGRIPLRFNRDNRYVDHKFQIMPKEGYTAMMEKMLNHPNIQVSLNTDFEKIRDCNVKPTVYTGPIDEYFQYRYGRLPWRSLMFKHKVINKPLIQPCVQINYPNEFEYTRSIEIKHVTQQQHKETVVTYEYPTSDREPYYPIPSIETELLYDRYKELAKQETKNKNVFFTGRMAEYAYLNMDEVIEKALNTFEVVKHRLLKGT